MKLLTVNDVAQTLSVSNSLVYQLVATGKLPCHRIGTGRGAIRVRRDDLEAFLAECRTQPPVQSGSSSPEPKGGCFKHLDGQRLLAAWQQRGVRVDRPSEDNAPSFE